MKRRTIQIRDTPVRFPAEKQPYRAQIIMMNHAWDSIVGSRNAAFESPTGTGKTLAIMSIALATRHWVWRQYGVCIRRKEPVKDNGGRNESNDAASEQEEQQRNDNSDGEDDDAEDFEEERVVYYERREPEGESGIERRADALLPRLIPRDETRIPFCIYIATRTNKQASQVVTDIRRSGYYETPVCLLASRKEYCLQGNVRSSMYRNEKCSELVRNGECGFYNNAGVLVVDEKFSCECEDIEDLCSRGEELCGCPYYASRAAIFRAEVVVCTYSYILDEEVRNACDIDLKGQVVIFDEAHNVESYCRSSLGWTLRVGEAELMSRAVDDMLKSWDTQKGPRRELTNLDHIRREGSTGDDPEKKVCQKLAFYRLRNLPVAIDRLVWKLVSPSAGDSELFCPVRYEKETNMEEYMLRGEQLIAYLNASSLGHVDTRRWAKLVKFLEGHIRKEEVRDCVLPFGWAYEIQSARDRELEEKDKRDDRIRKRVEDEADDTGDQGKRKRPRKVGRSEEKQWSSKVTELLRLATQVERAVANATKAPNDFVMIVRMKRQRNRRNVLDATVRLECLNPAICIAPVDEMARSIIMMSGTMSPLDKRLSKELGVEFATMRRLPHIVDTRQNLRVVVVSQGKHNKAPISSELVHRRKDEVRKEMMICIIDIVKASHGGVIVFFPSYEMMVGLSTEWYECEEFQDFLQTLGFFGTEPSFHGEGLESVIKTYCKASKTEKGALLFCVYRGKLSEGVDFHDEYCRTAILVGIPHANPTDSVVNAKKQWNDRQVSSNAADSEHFMSGRDWVQRHAFQAVNQAAGRVVRHKDDYGAIVLLDRRFLEPKAQDMLSEWIREGLQKTAMTLGTGEPTYGKAVAMLRAFFHEKKKKKKERSV